MYLRFIGSEIDARTGKPKGIFTVAYELAKQPNRYHFDEQYLKDLLTWFSKNLPVPKKFSRTKNVSHRNTVGISWMKAENSELTKRIWDLKQLIEMEDIHTEVIKTRRPGYIVYEDDFQIVAEPFHREKIEKL